jgi:hypothetical protein
MAIVDQITYALLGALFGALVGVACWWLYGLAHSLNYYGPGMDPVLRHWVSYAGGAFAVTGFATPYAGKRFPPDVNNISSAIYGGSKRLAQFLGR